MGRLIDGDRQEKSKQFFCEQKNQKTLILRRTLPESAATALAKVFCYFSSEK